jgi:superfamily I DNA/RNA helicase/Zn-dependent peptidase ImmA (M78 family)
MSSWSEIRALAGAWHDELANGTPTLIPATDILERAVAATGLTLLHLPADDILLDGAEGLYDGEGGRILIAKELVPTHAPFVLAHELGHHRLHDLHSRCSSDDVDIATPAEPERSVVGELDGYSPKERAEAQANLFARELLLPRHKLRAVWNNSGRNAQDVAEEVGLSLDLVLQQLADAILLPDEPPAKIAKVAAQPDPSQLAAATAGIGPHQVRAGPGTGKTRTLLARIKWLTGEKGHDPATIVALTYSNDSAADLATRLRAEIGELAPSVWTGTFHAFGLELLRKYGEAIGLPPELKPFDRSDSLFLLEELLPSFSLHHYLDLRDPLRMLKGVLGAISRAKDQLATPEDYARLAAKMAEVPDRKVEAERAAEVAHIYAVYQRALEERGAADFGDLIMRAHELLSGYPDVLAEVRARARHVLVDEYQDMNRASAFFLKSLVTPGEGPWVVGDARQSIYRFRGASPLNMTKFADDFPGATFTDLEVNYRSGGRIVRTFSDFGAAMGGQFPPMAKLEAKKGEDVGTVTFSLAASFEAEAEGIARTIREANERAGAYRDHVVLARSHTTLTRLAAHLERSGIPSLYFGDFFERPEIRDLLSLLSVAGEKSGLGLLRVAQLEPYQVPIEDITALCAWRRTEDLRMLEALRRAGEAQGLSDEGCAGLLRLAEDLDGVEWTTSPHRLLLDFLFCKGRVRSGALTADGAAGQQARLATYQLLAVAFDFHGRGKKDPKAAFLDHVRRLELLDEEKEYRTMPAAAAGIDAVRLMTVHASKGLEFRHVHIVALSPYYFPAPNRHNPCPLPAGMLPEDPLMGRESEEDGLFFVALSRAEDSLNLSRALRYGLRSSKPSRFLDPIRSRLCRPIDGTPNWTDEGPAAPAFPPLRPIHPLPDELPIRTIETYETCPRRYYYEQGLGLSGRTANSPFLSLISSLRATLAWARAIPDDTERREGWLAEFDRQWTRLGPADHAFSGLYRASGVRMMEQALEVTAGPGRPVERSMAIGGTTITARADSIVARGPTIVIQRLKAAPLAKTESARTGHGVLVEMVRKDHPGLSVAFEHVSLHDGERKAGFVKSEAVAKACGNVAEALHGIGEGAFPPIPDDRRCPECPFYFACPAEGIPIRT